MLKACIEIVSNGKYIWTTIPNENLGEEIYNFANERDWECTMITGLVKNGKTEFTNNSFYKCNLHDLNQMLLQANDFQYTIENLAILNLLLEHYNYDCNDVISAYENSNFRVYNGAEDMEDVAIEYIENNYSWLEDAEDDVDFSRYFNFKSYGEEVLGSDGTWLQDKANKIIIEVFD